ncbi:MAG: diguanylate cyclase [Methylobacteriaceae bacterium]|nr:diguanylate cyclase [Methylobacteriaceae bacterium]
MDAGEVYGPVLDALEIALAEYGPDLKAVRWNATFERFFPEHAGRIHVGEPYAENLRRFYQARLEGEDLLQLDRLVSEGVRRHLRQAAPFEFTHHGRTLRVAALSVPGGGRVRIWKEIPRLGEATGSALRNLDALEALAEGACILDGQNRILTANRRFRELYDVADGRPLVGEMLDDVVAAAWGPGAALAALRSTIRNGLRYDGAPFLIELPGDRWRRVVTRHADQGHACLVHSDVTGDERQNRELRDLAARDGLTGLANRRAFDETLGGAPRGTLLLIDADHFKAINDRYGHVAGDECLRRLAAILRDAEVGAGGRAARIGGEEFALLLPEIAPEPARAVAEAIRTRVADAGGGPPLSVSIGIASGEAAGLRLAADRALYEAKARGRNRVEMAEAIVAAAA